jgi:hypothetical protein
MSDDRPPLDDLLRDLLEHRRAATVTPAAEAAAAAPTRRIGGGRRRQSLRMGRSARRASAALKGYQRSRAAIGLAIVALIFAAAWLLNGYFTANTVVRAGGTMGWGWMTHLVLTVTELSPVFVMPYLRAINAPLWLYILIWAIVLPFGVFDTGSSALGFLVWADGLGLAWTTTTISVSTLLAEAIAFIPEPALFWLALAFIHLVNE